MSSIVKTDGFVFIVLAVLTASLIGVPKDSTASTVTQIDLSFQGFNLERFGGPIGTLALHLEISENAPDDVPSESSSQFAAPYTISFDGHSEGADGWIQFRDVTDRDQLFFTVPFPSGTVPGTPLNTTISGIELGLLDSTRSMVSSANPADLATDFASHVTDFAYSLRIGGWSAGEGRWWTGTGDSLGTAAFQSVVIHDPTPVPILGSFVLMLSALPILFATNAATRRRSALTDAI